MGTWAPALTDLCKSITISNPTNTDDFAMWITDQAITITKVRGVRTSGTSFDIDIVHGTDRSAAGTSLFTADKQVTSATTGDTFTTTINDATCAAGEIIRCKIKAVSGSVTEAQVTIYYRIG